MVLKENEQPIEVPFEIIESGANTFTQIEIQLPVNLNNNLVFDLDEIALEGLGELDSAAAVMTNSNFQLTLTTQAAMIQFNDDDLIAKRNVQTMASAANVNGGILVEELHMDTKGRANYIARDSVFASVFGVNQATALAVRGRLIGSLVKLKLENLTQLVLNQLS